MSEKRVSLIAINARYSHTNLAVLYLRETIRDLPWDCRVKSFSINTSFYDILEGIAADDPDVLALSVYIWNAELVRRLLPELKKICPRATLVLGGPEVSYSANRWLDDYPEDIDYIIIGAGEKGFRYLLENDLKHPERLVNIGALPFDEIPFPYIDEDFSESENRILYYESSRGCPFKCSFCLSSRDDQKLDYRDLDKVREELAMLVGHNPDLVKFVDRSFNAKAKIAREIWRILLELKPRTRFHFELHPLLLTDEDFELLAQVPEGLFQFEIGIQTLNEESQVAIRRRNHWHRMKPNIERLVALGNIHVHVDFIAGLPFEDWDSTRDSFNGIYELGADVMQFGFLKIIPGTFMADQIEEFGLAYIQSAPYQILKTKWLSFDELAQLREMEQTLNAIYNAEQFKKTEKALTAMHDNPFDAYQQIAIFGREQDYLESKGWAKVAEWIQDYIKTRFPDKLLFIEDCLRWDWAQLPKRRSYPPSLNRAVKEELSHLRKHLPQICAYNECQLPDEAFKSSIFFLPKSDAFRKGELCVFFDRDGRRESRTLQLPAAQLSPDAG